MQKSTYVSKNAKLREKKLIRFPISIYDETKMTNIRHENTITNMQGSIGRQCGADKPISQQRMIAVEKHCLS